MGVFTMKLFPLQQSFFAFNFLDIGDVLRHFYHAFVIFIGIPNRKISNVNQSVFVINPKRRFAFGSFSKFCPRFS